jgi:hypothetical protein
MAEKKTELRKIRDFGANLSDTFDFIRQYFKPLMSAFLGIAGVFMLAMAVMNGVMESSVFSSLRTLQGTGRAGLPLMSAFLYSSYFSMPFLMNVVSMWVGYTAMLVAIVAFMKYVDQHDGAAPGFEDVWKIFRRYYPRMLLYMIPVTVMIAGGTLLCVVPGIFLSVLLVPFGWVVMTEDAGLSVAVTRCFDLSRNHFWISLAVYMVSTLIYLFASFSIGMVGGLISLLAGYLTDQDLSSKIGVMTAVLRIFGFLFYVIFLVSAGLHYYNLVERLDAVGITRRIEEIGTRPDTDQGHEENY